MHYLVQERRSSRDIKVRSNPVIQLVNEKMSKSVVGQ